MGRILGLVNRVWATAQERKMHAIRQRFNLYAGGSLSDDVRRFFQLINAEEVLGTHSQNPINGDAPRSRRSNDQTSLVASGQNESAPETGALPKFVRASGSDLGRLDLQTLTGACDRDRPRLHRLRNLAHKVDV